ncbi:MAG: hypothetical protein WC423_23000 [Vulcanimicrobiota bacterium]
MSRYRVHPRKSGGIGAPPVADLQTVIAELEVDAEGVARWAILVPAYTAALQPLFMSQPFNESSVLDGLSPHGLTLVAS